MNIERLRRLMRNKKVTPAGLKAAVRVLDPRRGKILKQELPATAIPPDILKQLRKDRTTWNNFKRFPASYKRIRIGWIDTARRRPEVFAQRLQYFLKMTKRNKQFGMVR
jgi:hypothetical protein